MIQVQTKGIMSVTVLGYLILISIRKMSIAKSDVRLDMV